MFEQFEGLELNTFSSVFEVTFGVLVAFSTFFNFFIRRIKKITLSEIANIPKDLTVIENNIDLSLKRRISALDNHYIEKEISEQWKLVKDLQATISNDYLFPVEFKGEQNTKDLKSIYFEKHSKKDRNYLEKKVRSKFSPLLEACITYTGIILILSGFDDGTKILYLDIINKYTIVETFDKIIIKTLFYLNICVCSFLIHLFSRQYRNRGLKNKIMSLLHYKVALLGVPTIIVFIFLFLSIALALISGEILNSDGFHVFIIFFTIINTLLTLIFIITWSTIGTKLKYERLKKDLQTLKEIVGEIKQSVMEEHLNGQPSKAVNFSERAYLTDNLLSKLKSSRKSRRDILYEKIIKRKWGRLLAAIIVVVILFTISTYTLHVSNDKIEKLIIDQGKMEIESYYNLPKIDTSWFDNYFVYNAPIRKRLYNSLIRHNNQQLILNHSERLSNKHILKNLKYLEKKGDTLYIETSEYWYLRWYNSKEMTPEGGYMTPVYYPQYYTLVKNSMSEWKIYDIEYFGVSF